MLEFKNYFAYLDHFYQNSKESGEDATRMFDAPTYLMSFFGLTNVEAMEVCYAWMKTFDENQTLDERVALAEAARPPVKAKGG